MIISENEKGHCFCGGFFQVCAPWARSNTLEQIKKRCQVVAEKL